MRFYKTLKYILLFVFLSSSAMALGASFIFTPFEKQLRDSDAAILGTVRDSTIKKNPNGQVVTRYSLELSWAAGLNRDQGVHSKSFHINVPGGSWQGVKYQMSGAPEFAKGEEVFLLLKDSKFGHVVFNLSLGKYDVYKKSQNVFLKSSVFPEHPELGQMKLERIKELAEESFKMVSRYESDEKVINHNLKRVDNVKSSGVSRGVASASSFQENEGSSSSLFWPFIVLVFIATSRKILRLRSR